MIFVIFLLILALGGYFAWYNSAEQKGKRGEQIVADMLAQLSSDYVTLNDVIIKGKGWSTQMDHVVVSKFGVFVIETKNYRGTVYGSDNLDKWKQIIRTDVTYRKNFFKTYTYITKNYLYNPVKQNQAHAKVLKRLLTSFPYLPVFPIVVFVGDADLKIHTRYSVIYAGQLLRTIYAPRTEYLRKEDVSAIVELILSHNCASEVEREAHENYVSNREMNEQKVSSRTCPRCGGNLILRHGSYGSFWGCTNYPMCNYIKK